MGRFALLDSSHRRLGASVPMYLIERAIEKQRWRATSTAGTFSAVSDFSEPPGSV
jgi:hypothetical protein